MTRPGLEPAPPAFEANTLTITLSGPTLSIDWFWNMPAKNVFQPIEQKSFNKIKKAQVRRLIAALMVPALALLFHIKFYVNSSSFFIGKCGFNLNSLLVTRQMTLFHAAIWFLPSLRLRRRRLTQYRIFASVSSLT